MQLETTNGKWLELTTKLIQSNRQFTDALKAKKPHSELVGLYAQIQVQYHQLHLLKEGDVSSK